MMRIARISKRRQARVVAVIAAGLLAACVTVGETAPNPVTYMLTDPDLIHYYPNAEDTMSPDFTTGIPPFYTLQTGFPSTLEASIEKFTTDSLNRDGIAFTSVKAAAVKGGVQVTIEGSDGKAAGYKHVMPKLMSSDHAGLGLRGQKNCVTADWRCWNPVSTQSKTSYGKTYAVAPWAYYLPLGLPVINQRTVMFLNYPPSDSLCTADYLQNFTMRRWLSVLNRAEVQDPVLYETIVDAHPLAAPGSGQSPAIAFTTNGYTGYAASMLALLSKAEMGGEVLPVIVSGSDAQKVWTQLTGLTRLQAGMVGVNDIKLSAGKTASIPWIATNHPDVTTYNACPGDNQRRPYHAKSDSGDSCNYTGTDDSLKDYYTALNAAQAGKRPKIIDKKKYTYTNDQLIADEILDLVAACTMDQFVNNTKLKGTALERLQAAQTACGQEWCTEDTCAKRTDVCIQARLDYDFVYEGNCECEKAAAAFCFANNDNICPGTTSEALSCKSYNDKHCGS